MKSKSKDRNMYFVLGAAALAALFAAPIAAQTGGIPGVVAPGIEMEDAIDANIGEVEAAVRRADGPFCESETLLHQLALDAGRDNARDASCLRGDGWCKKRNERRCTEDEIHVPVFAL